MKKRVTKKHAAIGAGVALVLTAMIALVSNAGRVCAAVESPMLRAICDTVVETAQEHRGAEQLDGGAGGTL